MSEISAYHEAGHAFMAIYVGARIRCVTIAHLELGYLRTDSGDPTTDFDAWRERRLGSAWMFATAAHRVDVIDADRVCLDQNFSGGRLWSRNLLISHDFRVAVIMANDRVYDASQLADSIRNRTMVT